MATINIGGRRVKVDDGFLSLSPEDQQKTVDEIEASLSGDDLLSARGEPTPEPPGGFDDTVPLPRPRPYGDEGPPPAPPRTVQVPQVNPMGDATGFTEDVVPGGEGGIPASRIGKFALQRAPSGILSTLMLPLDAPAYLQSGARWGVDKLLDAPAAALNMAFGKPLFQTSLGRDATPPSQRRPEPPESIIGVPSERVKEGVSALAGLAGYTPAVPQNASEELLANVIEQGAGAATGAMGLAKIAPMRMMELAKPGALPLALDKYLKPYAANPVRTIIGDTAGGMGAGGALTASQQIPDSIRESGGGTVGVLADLVSMGLGGVASGTLASAMMGAPTTAGNAFRASRAAKNISLEPASGAATSNRTADAAARILQSSTSGRSASESFIGPRPADDVAQQVGQRAGAFRDQDLPVPTTDLLTDDIGLAGLGKRQRTLAGSRNTQFSPDLSPEIRQQYNFATRDEAQRQAAIDEVKKVQQPGVDQELFQNQAATLAQQELDAKQRGIDRANRGAQRTEQVRAVPANELRANVGQTPGASSDIFDTYAATRTAEQERSGALYGHQDWTQTQMPITPMLDAADAITARATGTSPVTPRAQAIIDRIEAAREGGNLPGWEISKLNKDIEAQIKLALKDGEDFQQLKELKDSIAQTVTQLPAGSPPRVAVENARENYATRVQPNFREGAGGALDKRLKTDPGQVVPEEAGAKFLNRGQDAEQLMSIANLRGNAQEVAANARTIIMDRLAQGGVIRDGAIDADALVAWRNKRANVIDQIPGVGDEINNMIASARRGSATAGRFADEIAAAEARFAQTQREIKAGPVGKIEGKTPQEAVAAVMNGNNAAKNMAELRVRLGGSAEAERSLKAAVADHFADQVTGFDARMAGNEGVSLPKLIKNFNEHRATLVAAGFDADDMNAVQRAQTVLSPLAKRNVQATIGSTTAESQEAVMKPLELALKMHYGTLKGGSVFRNVKTVIGMAKGDISKEVEQLITRAMFDPELAQVLLTRDVAKAGTPAWNAELQKVLRRNQAFKAAAEGENSPEEQKAP